MERVVEDRGKGGEVDSVTITGLDAGLRENRLRMYIEYVKSLWGEDKLSPEELEEWARRFLIGFEYVCSDKDGRSLLRKMTLSHWSQVDSADFAS